MRKICLIIALLVTTCQYRSATTVSAEYIPVYPQQIKKEETRQKIAIIDTGINETDLNRSYLCDSDLHKDFTNTGINDTHGHGSHIASIVIKGMDPRKQCLVIIKYYQPSGNAEDNLENTVSAFLYTKSISAFAVNYSGGGLEPSEKEKQAIMDLLDSHIYVSVAAGNERYNLSKKCQYFPACYEPTEEQSPYFFVVTSGVHKNNKIKYHTFANFGGPAKYVRNGKNVTALIGYNLAYMSGTSQSTAIVTQEIVKKAAESRPIQINFHEDK